MLEDFSACRVVDVDDCGFILLMTSARHHVEKSCLRPQIIFHRAVEVQMVLREVREYRRIEFDARNSMFGKRMA